jgi:hypothetical protein
MGRLRLGGTIDRASRGGGREHGKIERDVLCGQVMRTAELNAGKRRNVANAPALCRANASVIPVLSTIVCQERTDQ